MQSSCPSHPEGKITGGLGTETAHGQALVTLRTLAGKSSHSRQGHMVQPMAIDTSSVAASSVEPGKRPVVGTHLVKKSAMRQKTFEPKFEQRYDERCDDCEYNGYLTDDGFPRKGFPVHKCSRCGGKGRIRLVTWEMIRSDIALLAKLTKPGYRLARRSELLDPYAIAKRG